MGNNNTRPVSPLICSSQYFSSSLDNYLGVVYESMLTYVNMRKARSPGDRVSFIAFDCEANVIFEEKPAGDSDILAQMLSVHPR